MPVPKLLGEGNFMPADITVHVNDEKLPNLVPELVDSEWRDQLKLAEDGGYELWDSECYSLLDCVQEKGKIALSLGLVDYKYVRGVTPSIERGDLDACFESSQMFSSLLIRTADNKYIFGLGAKQIHIGTLKFVGGVYSKAENIVTDPESLFQSARNELEEEINVSRCHVRSMTLKRIYATIRGLRDLCFLVDLNINSHEVKRLFDLRKDDEMADLLVLTPEEARREIASLPDDKREKANLVEIS